MIREGGMAGIAMENPIMMQTFVENLWKQSNGDEGEIFLTDGDKSFRMDKDVRVVFNPFAIDINERKILTKLMGELQEISETELYIMKTALNSAIVSFIEEVSGHIPYPVSYSLDLDVQQLLKVYDVRLDMQCSTLLERVIDYMKLSHQVLGVKLFVFVHLRDYFSNEDFDKLYEMVAYEQLSVLLLESRAVDTYPKEQWWIVDADNCIIEI